MKEMRQRPAEELGRELGEQRDRLRVSRFELAAGRVKNIRTIRKTRRAIARLLTVPSHKPPSSLT